MKKNIVLAGLFSLLILFAFTFTAPSYAKVALDFGGAAPCATKEYKYNYTYTEVKKGPKLKDSGKVIVTTCVQASHPNNSLNPTTLKATLTITNTGKAECTLSNFYLQGVKDGSVFSPVYAEIKNNPKIACPTGTTTVSTRSYTLKSKDESVSFFGAIDILVWKIHKYGNLAIVDDTEDSPSIYVH